MRIIITGGCGFLGSNIAKKLLEEKHEILIIDTLERLGSKKNLEWLTEEHKFKFLEKDIVEIESFKNEIVKFEPDSVLHLAGQVAMTTSLENPKRDFMVNAYSTLQILELLRTELKNTQLIYSSTNKVYGDLEHLNYLEHETRYSIQGFENGIPEDIRLEMSSPYGCSKGSADQYILDYAKNFGIRSIVFRHSSIFGKRQFSTFDQGWIGWFVMKAIEAKNNKSKLQFDISGNGKQVRDVLFSDDLVELYFKAIHSEIYGQAYNIGGGVLNSLSLLELFEQIKEKLDISYTLNAGPWRSSDQKVFIADTSKVRRELEWTQKISTDEGLDEMLNWVAKL
jgi:CDP-paratose 2-epimerase